MPPAELAGRPAWPGRTGHRQAAGLRAGTRGAPGVCGAALPACLGHGRGRPDSGCGPPPCCSAGRGDPGRRARARPQSSGRGGGRRRGAGARGAAARARPRRRAAARPPPPPPPAPPPPRTCSPGARRHRYPWLPLLVQTRQARRPCSDRCRPHVLTRCEPSPIPVGARACADEAGETPALRPARRYPAALLSLPAPARAAADGLRISHRHSVPACPSIAAGSLGSGFPLLRYLDALRCTVYTE